ncbi:MAG: bifunctional folylpolyglutamate synthase/dihydrofolate synthase [Myxococcales bacterium]|nr:bifunctional folylpolyglutamate synthase/dihydrofolate synthase [Myxococcales bacterium]
MAPRSADYAHALGGLFAARRFGVKLTLDGLRACLARLGHPEAQLGAIAHVAGTNGKGSTVAMLAGLARAAGVRVAQYTSPHLVTVRERIVVDGVPISEGDFVAALRAVHAAGGAELTFFEQLTAAALWYFAQSAPELTILEVGLGGRGDATNVINGHAAVSAVTGVALDHMDVLGDSLAAIAREKAGIFARGGHAIIGGAGDPAAAPELVACAQQAGVAHVTRVGAAELLMLPRELALIGPHQRQNAACAVAIANALALGALPTLAKGRGGDGVWRALASPQWMVHPGRYERCRWRGTAVILDGAHNPDGAAALAIALAADASIARAAPRVLVFAASADKDLAGIARPLVAWATEVIGTTFSNDRAASALAAAAAGQTSRHEAAMRAALDAAATLAGPGGTVVVAGSLMAIGEARALILGLTPDPIAISDPRAGTKPAAT